MEGLGWILRIFLSVGVGDGWGRTGRRRGRAEARGRVLILGGWGDVWWAGAKPALTGDRSLWWGRGRKKSASAYGKVGYLAKSYGFPEMVRTFTVFLNIAIIQ